MARAQATTNHDKIRKWVESRGGHPSAVKATRRAGSPGGLLRIDFGPQEEGLEELPWDEFFQAFDGNELAFLYQDKTADGKTSRFFKFVDRNTLDEDTLNASDEDDEDEDEDDEDEDEDADDDEDTDDDDDDEDWDDEDDEDFDEDEEDEDEDEDEKPGKKKR
jgi:hypothetical protein